MNKKWLKYAMLGLPLVPFLLASQRSCVRYQDPSEGVLWEGRLITDEDWASMAMTIRSCRRSE